MSESVSDGEADPALDHVGVGLERVGGGGGAGEGHEVAVVQVVQQGADEPEISCSEPSGRMPDSSIALTTAAATYPVGVAGLTMVGTPAMKAGANFSSMPQTGKLKALICTATPGMRV